MAKFKITTLETRIHEFNYLVDAKTIGEARTKFIRGEYDRIPTPDDCYDIIDVKIKKIEKEGNDDSKTKSTKQMVDPRRMGNIRDDLANIQNLSGSSRQNRAF